MVKKMGLQDLSVGKAMGIFFLFLLIFMIIFVKGLGSTDMPINVEKNGYCKIVYDDGFRYRENIGDCYNSITKESITFTPEEFRKACPKNKFISDKFYSNCFFEGDGF